MTWNAQELQAWYHNNPASAKVFFNANPWEVLQSIMLADEDGGPAIRFLKDDHPLAPIVIDDPDPTEFDALGVSGPDERGFRELLAFNEYCVERQRHALEASNQVAYLVARDFQRKLIWHDETGNYFDEIQDSLVEFVFGNHAWFIAFTKNDRDFAVMAPKMEPGVPASLEAWVRDERGYRQNHQDALVLLDSFDEDKGPQVSNDDISPERAVEIAKEALDKALADAQLPGWDEFGGDD